MDAHARRRRQTVNSECLPVHRTWWRHCVHCQWGASDDSRGIATAAQAHDARQTSKRPHGPVTASQHNAVITHSSLGTRGPAPRLTSIGFRGLHSTHGQPAKARLITTAIQQYGVPNNSRQSCFKQHPPCITQQHPITCTLAGSHEADKRRLTRNFDGTPLTPTTHSILCTPRMCWSTWPFCVNALPHSPQMYGFSPVCERLWTMSLLFSRNDRSHSSH